MKWPNILLQSLNDRTSQLEICVLRFLDLSHSCVPRPAFLHVSVHCQNNRNWLWFVNVMMMPGRTGLDCTCITWRYISTTKGAKQLATERKDLVASNAIHARIGWYTFLNLTASRSSKGSIRLSMTYRPLRGFDLGVIVSKPIDTCNWREKTICPHL